MAMRTSKPEVARWHNRPWVILLLLFVVLGPLALPLLWRSPRFSRPMKVALTVLTLAYTALLVALGVQTVETTMRNLGELTQ